MSSFRKKISLSAGLAMIFSDLANPVLATGFRIPNQDAEAVARGNAFIATADNPSAVYYNPAGITQLDGHHSEAGIYALAARSEFRSVTGERAHTRSEIQSVPHLYYVASPDNKPFSLGVGLYVPFGLGLEWPDDSPFRSVAVEGRLAYFTLNPVVAYQVHPTLSIAAGPTLNYSRVKLTRGLLVPRAAGDEFEFEGDGSDYGYTAGVLWKPLPTWSFGAVYRSGTRIEYEGKAKAEPLVPFKADTEADLDFPQMVGVGIAYRPTPKWNLEVDVDWTDWDQINTVTFEGTSALFGVDAQLPLNWRSSFIYSFGVTRELPRGFFASAGYFFAENSTSERNFSPAVPDTDLHVGSIGFGYRGDKWQWALAGQILTGPAREVRDAQSTSLIGEPVNGDYQWINKSLTASIRYRF